VLVDKERRKRGFTMKVAHVADDEPPPKCGRNNKKRRSSLSPDTSASDDVQTLVQVPTPSQSPTISAVDSSGEDAPPLLHTPFNDANITAHSTPSLKKKKKKRKMMASRDVETPSRTDRAPVHTEPLPPVSLDSIAGDKDFSAAPAQSDHAKTCPAESKDKKKGEKKKQRAARSDETVVSELRQDVPMDVERIQPRPRSVKSAGSSCKEGQYCCLLLMRDADSY